MVLFDKPFQRNYRPVKRNSNSGYSSWAYIVDHDYANNPLQYTRGFISIQEELKSLFDYIEPADVNLNTFSYKIQQLLIRTCIEVESNFKAILKENVYKPKTDKGKNIPEKQWKMMNYGVINKTHHLDEYVVRLPYWNGKKNVFSPFHDWKKENNYKLDWYDAYNQCKHNRAENFPQANFKNLLNAVSALLIVLSSQFGKESFMPGNDTLEMQTDSYYKGNFALGDFFLIEYPKWNENEMYDFDWSELKNSKVRFNKIDYDLLSCQKNDSDEINYIAKE